MSNIIKEIEAEQLKETVDQFEVGDTVKVYGKIKEGNRERIQKDFQRYRRREDLAFTFSQRREDRSCKKR